MMAYGDIDPGQVDIGSCNGFYLTVPAVFWTNGDQGPGSSIRPFHQILWKISLTNLLEANKIAEFYRFVAISSGKVTYTLLLH